MKKQEKLENALSYFERTIREQVDNNEDFWVDVCELEFWGEAIYDVYYGTQYEGVLLKFFRRIGWDGINIYTIDTKENYISVKLDDDELIKELDKDLKDKLDAANLHMGEYDD